MGPSDDRALRAVALGLAVLVAAAAAAARDEAAAPRDPDAAPVVYDAKGRRDPFIPLVRNGELVNVVGQSGTLDQPVLRGILWDPSGRSIALINDMEVNVGDLIGGYRVDAIRQDAVVLTVDGGEPLVLQLEFELPGASPDTATGGKSR